MPLRTSLCEHHGNVVGWVDLSRATHVDRAYFGSEPLVIIEHPVNWEPSSWDGYFRRALNSRLSFLRVYQIGGRGPVSVWHGNRHLFSVGPQNWVLAGHSVGESLLFTLHENIAAGGPLEVHITSTADRQRGKGELGPATGLVWLDLPAKGTRFVCVISEETDQSVPRIIEFEEFGRYTYQPTKAARLVLDPKTGGYDTEEDSK